MVEQMHAITVSEPLVAESSFACTMQMDVTMQGQGRFIMTELCVYEVVNGMIVVERFHPQLPAMAKRQLMRRKAKLRWTVCGCPPRHVRSSRRQHAEDAARDHHAIECVAPQ